MDNQAQALTQDESEALEPQALPDDAVPEDEAVEGAKEAAEPVPERYTVLKNGTDLIETVLYDGMDEEIANVVLRKEIGKANNELAPLVDSAEAGVNSFRRIRMETNAGTLAFTIDVTTK